MAAASAPRNFAAHYHLAVLITQARQVFSKPDNCDAEDKRARELVDAELARGEGVQERLDDHDGNCVFGARGAMKRPNIPKIGRRIATIAARASADIARANEDRQDVLAGLSNGVGSSVRHSARHTLICDEATNDDTI